MHEVHNRETEIITEARDEDEIKNTLEQWRKCGLFENNCREDSFIII